MDFIKLTDCYTLSNGVEIPCVGFGTWQSENGAEAYNAVFHALSAGYRHIDTATAYGNEESVGSAISDFLKSSGVKRDEIFVTTKLWNRDHGYERTKAAIDASLKNLKVDYLDLYLVHWPNPLAFRDCWKETNAESWRAMEEAYAAGKIRAIGLSNFCVRHIEPLLETAQVKPMVNQLKLCPGIAQKELCDYSSSLGMVLEAYSPLGTGAIFSNDFMRSLAKKYGRSIAQICIRWSLQNGFLPLPKSVTKDRIEENAKVFDFELDFDDCEKIACLSDTGIRPNRNPDEAEF
ncbi:MAG: aldo/keto reductase [Treponema sp.]|nr:aldo/keto reductase [Treponema sp.]